MPGSVVSDELDRAVSVLERSLERLPNDHAPPLGQSGLFTTQHRNVSRDLEQELCRCAERQRIADGRRRRRAVALPLSLAQPVIDQARRRWPADSAETATGGAGAVLHSTMSRSVGTPAFNRSVRSPYIFAT